jgi:hypothetical protein
LACVGFAHGTWLAAGEAGTILLSLNTVDWVLQDGATINRLASMAYGNGLFVAVGDNGAIVTSSDGVYWSVSDSRTTRSLVAVEFGNGRFVAVAGRVGVQGLAVSSLDGTNWVASSTPLMGITGVAFGVGRFVSPAQGRVYSSADGREWSEHDLVGDRPAAGPLAYNNGTFVSAGLYGVILQSDPSVGLAASFDGSLHLSIEGPKNRIYRIDSRDAFDDSASWEEVTTLPAGPYLWTYPGPLSSATRYYRAVLLPVQ